MDFFACVICIQRLVLLKEILEKGAKMAESPKEKLRQPISSIFTSPRFLASFVSKGSVETESLTSPTSIMDTKPFCVLKNPFRSETSSPKPECKNLWDNLESRGVSLGLIEALIDENPESNLSRNDSRMVLFGSQLRIQVPPLPPSMVSPAESPKSPGDFGIKTRHSHVGSFSPSSNLRRSPFGSMNSGGFSSLSASEMELSEDYTCVISYGPNPRTTHIFDDCIVESCCGVVKFSESRKESGLFSTRSLSYPSESFLSFCYSCKKNLGQGKDIYMYR